MTQRQDGSWSAGAHHATAAALVRAFDPEVEFVVVEGHAPALPGWQFLPVPVTSDPASSRTRVVRGARFDLLMTPAELLDVGTGWDDASDGGLYAWQTPQRPPEFLSLLQKDKAARLAAQRGVNVQLLIDLPHAAETAVLWSPTRDILQAALDRLNL